MLRLSLGCLQARGKQLRSPLKAYVNRPFRNHRWFTRGWTLQELIAPEKVEFFSGEGLQLGDKIFLEQQIHDITGIPICALRGDPLSNFSVAERMTWVEKRETTVEEDKAYSLFWSF